jgi:hypothetical protein
MIRCEDCEFFRRGPDGSPMLLCDPFSTIKEPECLSKWQVYQLGTIARSHEATLEMYQKFAPMQEKMLRHMEREMDDFEETEGWKYGLDDDDDDDDDDDEDDPFRV